jgi:capsular polysaccharide biosynthesis protein
VILKLEEILNRSVIPERRSLKVNQELSRNETAEETGFEIVKKRLEEVERKLNNSKSESKVKEKLEETNETITKLEHEFWGGKFSLLLLSS